jgi:dipeptidyl aminopeptidase/acylaminoacyl peptidase
MDARRTLWTVAAFLLLVACSDGSAPDRLHPTARASATPSIPLGTRSAVTSLSGRIVFDNFDDVWSINADGTGLTRLTRSPGPDFDATWSPDGARIAFRSGWIWGCETSASRADTGCRWDPEAHDHLSEPQYAWGQHCFTSTRTSSSSAEITQQPAERQYITALKLERGSCRLELTEGRHRRQQPNSVE